MWRGGALSRDRGAGETHLELLGVNGAGAVGIEEVEGLTDLLLLLLGQVGPGGALGASASATVSLRAPNVKLSERQQISQLARRGGVRRGLRQRRGAAPSSLRGRAGAARRGKRGPRVWRAPFCR